MFNHKNNNHDDNNGCDRSFLFSTTTGPIQLQRL